MTVIPRKVRREHGEYWELVDVKRVNGKVVQKYVGYLGEISEFQEWDWTGRDTKVYITTAKERDKSGGNGWGVMKEVCLTLMILSSHLLFFPYLPLWIP